MKYLIFSALLFGCAHAQSQPELPEPTADDSTVIETSLDLPAENEVIGGPFEAPAHPKRRQTSPL
jgi:hypothetical protein